MNTYTDSKYELNFIFQSDSQLSQSLMAKFADIEIERRKSMFFESWRERHDDWEGDIEEKKEELFLRKHRKGQQMVVSFDPSQLEE